MNESAILLQEREIQVRDAAEFVVGNGFSPAANHCDVVDGDNDVEVVERAVHEACFGADLTTGLQKA